MANLFNGYCFRCKTKNLEIVKTKNKYEFCLGCLREIYYLGISFKTIKDILGKGKIFLK